MIRLVTTARVAQLERDAAAAYECARQVTGAANAAFGRHAKELYAVTDRAERAEAATLEVSEVLARAFAELAAAQEELLLKDIEIRRPREELEGAPSEGQTLTVLFHYGEPHTIYRTREEAKGETATHGLATDRWVPADERRASEVEWRLEAFTYDTGSNGFRRVFLPTPELLGGVA